MRCSDALSASPPMHVLDTLESHVTPLQRSCWGLVGCALLQLASRVEIGARRGILLQAASARVAGATRGMVHIRGAVEAPGVGQQPALCACKHTRRTLQVPALGKIAGSKGAACVTQRQGHTRNVQHAAPFAVLAAAFKVHCSMAHASQQAPA